MEDLFSKRIDIVPGMVLLRGFANSPILIESLSQVLAHSPLRQMETSRGFKMSVHTSNCGEAGWISDRRGYRYVKQDPLNGKPWPDLPIAFKSVAQDAAIEAGFSAYEPDVCLINRYRPGNQMGAHQDKDEQDFTQPIVSVSLGIDARFFVIGPEKRGSSTAVDLTDGDVLVFGGPARKFFHGVRKLRESIHPALGAVRWNLTFRKAL